MRWPILALILAPLSSAALAAPDPQAEDGEKVVCKRQVETGTLAKINKTCMTKNEWQRLRARSQELGQGLRDKGFSSCALRGGGALRPSEMGPGC